MSKTSQLSFNGGETTEFMDPRVDVGKYGKGCRVLENFYVLPFGSALARPGTLHGGAAKYQDRKCRLKDFSFSTTTTFDIEVGHEYFRFWKDQARVLTGGVAHEEPSPYQEEHLFELQFEAVEDVVYIVHPLYAFRKLVRFADDDWRLSLVDWSEDINYPPLDSQNVDKGKTVEIASGTFGTKGESVTVESNFDLFEVGQVGDMMTISHSREDTFLRETVTETGVSEVIYVLGDWAIQTTGTGVFKVTFEESEDRVTWENKRQYDIKGTENNALASGSEQTPKFFRINVTEYTSIGGSAIIEVSNPLVPGLVKITAFVDARNVTAEVIEPLHSDAATYRWAEQFFSSKKGHPRAICTHRNRLCIASRDILLSQPGNFENFRSRNDADSGFRVPVRRSGSPLIQWMEDLRELRVGTTQAEAVVIAENSNEAFSYSNYRVRWDTNYGSKHLRAEAVNGTALFLQPEGRTLRKQLLTGIEDYYDANTLTTFADHIAGEGIIQTAYQRQRYPTFHGVREDGQVASMLFEESQNVQAWYRMKTEGEIESISVTPRPDEEDRVAYAVKREVNGQTVRHIEFRAQGQYRVLQEGRLKEMVFVDDGKTVLGEAMTEIAGLEHLEGVTVAILADGAKVPDQVVSAGVIQLDTPADVVTVGRIYEMTLIPMYLESQGVMGRAKNISGAIIRLWRSGAARVRVIGEGWSRLSRPPEFLNEAPELQTGDSEKIHLGGVWDRNTTIEMEGRSPLPLNVQAITLEFEVGRG